MILEDAFRAISPSANSYVPRVQLVPGGFHFPVWIPCLACKRPIADHAEMKCLFEPTTFLPDTASEVIRRLGLVQEIVGSSWTYSNTRVAHAHLAEIYLEAPERWCAKRDADQAREALSDAEGAD